MGALCASDYRPSPMGRVLLDLYHRKLPALVEGGFDWVDVRDVVSGAIAAAERGQRGDKFLLSGMNKPIAELAQMVELTPPALSQYESGQHAPSAPVLTRLSLGLGVPRDFFLVT